MWCCRCSADIEKLTEYYILSNPDSADGYYCVNCRTKIESFWFTQEIIDGRLYLINREGTKWLRTHRIVCNVPEIPKEPTYSLPTVDYVEY